ncbi:MAG: radical SAM family heme chaperone HemW [Alphaproteobacteria bacterium]|nr:radical SAM family heme chaperone HemW [Alphaproteobacteria bacterium]
MSTIYVHWAFCLSKCLYCDFNSIVVCGGFQFDKWFDAYQKILLKFHREFYRGESITSVYFGGGTPSLLPSWFVADFLDEVRAHFALTANAEITLEANPKTLTKHKAIELKQAGINRLSIGVQSLIDSDLQMLGRIHNTAEAKRCVLEMVEIFDNVSIDMIYNRPGQSVSSWKAELEEALQLPLNHVSLYELIVEDGTPLKKMISSGALPTPSDTSEFFDATKEIAVQNGFEMYEVSNFAKNGAYGRHNMSYWKYEDYYGIGAGAHSRCTVNGHKVAIAQIADPWRWLDWVTSDTPAFDVEHLSEEDEFKERLIMGLRAKCGINIDDFSNDTRRRHRLDEKIKILLENSYIMRDGGLVTLTGEGIVRLNLIVRYLSEE